MNQYRFDLAAALRLRELLDQFGRMSRLEDLTAQRRGQQFNGFIAELFAYWGVDRVQAKWEKEPVSLDPIAKLSRRISQRFVGTRGVFLSMSGYTEDALSDMLRGQQPDMLLLDRTHFEAMLSGLFSPNDLFTELVDQASYRGEVYIPLTDLIVPAEVAVLPTLAPGEPTDYPVPAVIETVAGDPG